MSACGCALRLHPQALFRGGARFEKGRNESVLLYMHKLAYLKFSFFYKEIDEKI
jgi:hypothetical protein